MCQRCSAGKCNPDELPSATSPNGYPCPTCEGRYSQDCKTCHGRGQVEITCCPHALVPASIWALFPAAEFARKGVLANGQGFLNETAAAAEGIRKVWAEEARYRIKAGYKD